MGSKDDECAGTFSCPSLTRGGACNKLQLTAISFILTDVPTCTTETKCTIRNKVHISFYFLYSKHITQNLLHIKTNVNKHLTHITLVFDLIFCLGGVGFMCRLYHGQLCTNGNSLLGCLLNLKIYASILFKKFYFFSGKPYSNYFMVLTLVSSSTETSNTSDWMSSSAGCVSSASRHWTELSLWSNSDRIYNVINLMKNLPLGNIYSKNQHCTNTWVYDTVWTNLYLSKTKNQASKNYHCLCNWFELSLLDMTEFCFLILIYVIHTFTYFWCLKQ